MEKIILHADLNNFYASVEQYLNPELRNLAVAVCGDPKQRHGIVLAKSELAKKFGVKTGDTLWQAQNKCKDIIFVPPQFDEYVKFSNRIFDLYTTFTDRVESFGMDECWLDVTNSTSLFGNGKEIADKIREKVKNELGLTVSVGVSFTKVFAKLGSDMKKPDATTVITKENFKTKVWPLPADDMIFVGRKTIRKLNNFGVFTIGDLANAPEKVMLNNFGIVGKILKDNANGISNEEVKLYYDKAVPKSVSNGTTTFRDIMNLEEAKVVIFALSELVATRLRKHGLCATGISLGIKNTFLSSTSRHTILPFSTQSASTLGKQAIELLKEMHNFQEPLRAITVGAIRLEPATAYQMTFEEGYDDEKMLDLENSIDSIRNKYGYHSIKRGITMQTDLLQKNLHEEDEFEPFKR